MNDVILIGFMGAGKSSVGPLLADRLERPFFDLDDVIAADAGRTIVEIFRDEGEAGFRQREAAAIDALFSQPARSDRVIAVGGGAPMNDRSWRLLRLGNTVVALTAEPATIAARLNGTRSRPMLAAGVAAMTGRLLPERLPRYLEADLVLATDSLGTPAVADRIAERLPRNAVERIRVDVPGAPHEITIGYALGALVAPALRRAGVERRAVVVSDPNVGSRHAGALRESLGASGIEPLSYQLPAGERAKSADALAALYAFLAENAVERSDGLIALGGGVVGDLTGFAAATWLRGVSYLQMPTTLLAMVDSSIGGKTAINLAAGKNLVGAVYQPCAILADLAYLDTLPQEELQSGLAEVIKTAIIGDPTLFDWLSANRDAVLRRDPEALRHVVARSAAFKARLVGEDPREHGRRAILNYGHTVGHALERATGYGAMRHGRAVAWGMQVAADLSVGSGRCQPAVAAAQDGLLRAYGFLDDRPSLRREDLLEAIRHDKKNRSGEPRWVLVRDIGSVEHGCRVDPTLVEASLQRVLEI